MENEITIGLFVNLLAAVIIGLFANVVPKAFDYRGLMWVSILILLVVNCVFFLTTSSLTPFLVLVVIIFVVLNLRFRGPGAYLNKRKRFLMEFPSGWKEISFFESVMRFMFSWLTLPKGYPRLRLYSPDNPEFHGPNGEELTFSIGPTHPSVAFDPTVDEQLQKMRYISQKFGHSLKSLPPIRNGNKSHAVCLTSVPFGRDCKSNLVIKNYIIVFNNIEYFISAKLKITHPLDEVKTIGDEKAYDSVISSFHSLTN